MPCRAGATGSAPPACAASGCRPCTCSATAAASCARRHSGIGAALARRHIAEPFFQRGELVRLPGPALKAVSPTTPCIRHIARSVPAADAFVEWLKLRPNGEAAGPSSADAKAAGNPRSRQQCAKTGRTTANIEASLDPSRHRAPVVAWWAGVSSGNSIGCRDEQVHPFIMRGWGPVRRDLHDRLVLQLRWCR